MKKYWQIIKVGFAEATTYRLSFVLWRVRRVLNLLLVYFLWLALLGNSTAIFGYQQKEIITYILLSNIVGSFVFATKTEGLAETIVSGDLSNLLLRPFSPFLALAARDAGDKFMNIAFSVVEVILLIFFLKPALLWQTQPFFLLAFVLAVTLAIVLYFNISLLLGFVGFWSPEVWAPRFIFFVLINFFAGMLFPLDILPRPVFTILQALPFTYLLYFPLKVYLGQLSSGAILSGLFFSVLWTAVFIKAVSWTWQKGLRSFAAQGQ